MFLSINYRWKVNIVTMQFIHCKGNLNYRAGLSLRGARGIFSARGPLPWWWGSRGEGSRWHAWKGKIGGFIAQTQSLVENI